MADMIIAVAAFVAVLVGLVACLGLSGYALSQMMGGATSMVVTNMSKNRPAVALLTQAAQRGYLERAARRRPLER